MAILEILLTQKDISLDSRFAIAGGVIYFFDIIASATLFCYPTLVRRRRVTNYSGIMHVKSLSARFEMGRARAGFWWRLFKACGDQR
jgi:hypothetical protein